MRSSTQSRTIDDTLEVPDELRGLGVSLISRKGDSVGGFVIFFKIKSRTLSLYSKSKRDKMQAELEKALRKFCKKDDQLSEFQIAFESFIANNFEWMIGKQSSLTNEELDEILESDNYQKNYFDKYRDLDKSDPLLDYPETGLEDIAQMQSGKVKFTGRITVIADDVEHKTIRSRWICRTDNCPQTVEIPFRNLLNPPRMPKKCSICSQQDLGFDADHIDMTMRYFTVESEDIAQAKAPLPIKVYALDEYAINTLMSTQVTVYGEIVKFVDYKKRSNIQYIIAKRILYHDLQTVQIQPEDIPEINNLAHSKDLPKAIAELYATDIDGLFLEKFLAFLGCVGSPSIKNIVTGRIRKRGPLNILFIGLPGGAKTDLAVNAASLKPKSQVVFCQYTSVATLCGSVVTEDGKSVIKPGLAAMASGGILVLDELDKAKPDFKLGLLEIMEQNTITLGKNMKPLKFKAEVRIIATCNPRSENWANTNKLELSDLDLPNTIISRFDLIIPVRSNRTEEDWKKLSDFIIDSYTKDPSANDDLLAKFLQKTEEITHVDIDSNAKEILSNYASKRAFHKDLAYIESPRILITIHRIAKTYACCRLSDKVDKDIANETINLIDRILSTN